MGKRKPIIIGKKLRGEWAEMRFLVCATEHGLQVSKPWGDSRSYDFVVGRPGHFVAVQVKSTNFALEEGWMCNVCSCHNPYPPGSFDFLAAYVVFEDVWYIIPEQKILGMKSISLHTKCNKSKYEGYRDGWDLLQREAGPDATAGHIDGIQGRAEELTSAWDSEDATVARFLAGFPQGSTRESQRPQLLHKREMFFCCGTRQSAGK
jgi:hypothetical protein